MNDDKDDKFWVNAIKLAIVAVVLIILISLGLYYTSKFNTYEAPHSSDSSDWGIAKDSPIPSNR